MKKLFALITSLVMMMALFVVPITALADDEQADEGTELVNIDFSDDTVMSDFGGTWGAWIIDKNNETLRPESPWSNTRLNQAINFEGKRIVLTVDFVIEYTTDESKLPALTIGMANAAGRGASIRFLIDNESLYSYMFGNEAGWVMDTQWKFIREELVVHQLEMTFDLDKTLTVKVDGNILTHADGYSMNKISLVDIYEGFAKDFVGYFTVMASGGTEVAGNPDTYQTDTYIDNLKIVAYDTPAAEEDPPTPVDPTPVEPTPVEPDPSEDEPSLPEPPVEPDPGSGEQGGGEQGGNEPQGNNVEKGGCGSAISGFSIAALVLASGTALAVARRKRNK